MRLTVTLEDAQSFKDDISKLRSKCDQCAYKTVLPDSDDARKHAEHGWESTITYGSMVLRCAKCQDTAIYPWLESVDLSVVREWIQDTVDRSLMGIGGATNMENLLKLATRTARYGVAREQ